MIGHMLNDLAKAIRRLRELVDIWLQGRLQRDMQQPGRPSKLSRSRSADDLAAGAADPPSAPTFTTSDNLAGFRAPEVSPCHRGRRCSASCWSRRRTCQASVVRGRLRRLPGTCGAAFSTGFVGPVAKSPGTCSKCSCSESLCSTGRRPGMELYFSGYYTP